jgi:hypothetical protein
MKKALRLAFAVAVLSTITPMVAVASPLGTNPPPRPSTTTSTFSTVVATILTVLGL